MAPGQGGAALEHLPAKEGRLDCHPVGRKANFPPEEHPHSLPCFSKPLEKLDGGAGVSAQDPVGDVSSN